MFDMKLYLFVMAYALFVTFVSHFVLKVNKNLKRTMSLIEIVFTLLDVLAGMTILLCAIDFVCVCLEIEWSAGLLTLITFLFIIKKTAFDDFYDFIVAMVSVSIMRKKIKTIRSKNGSDDLIIDVIKDAYYVCYRDYGLFYKIAIKRFDKLMNEFNVYQVNGLPEFKFKATR